MKVKTADNLFVFGLFFIVFLILFIGTRPSVQEYINGDDPSIVINTSEWQCVKAETHSVKTSNIVYGVEENSFHDETDCLQYNRK